MEFKSLTISDIHFGHPTTNTAYIVESLRKFFITYQSKISIVKLIIIPGDVFHKLLGANSYDMMLATSWLTELVMFCKKFNIILRVLEGTESHDWHQMKVIYNIIDNLNIDLDFKYIDKLTIEHNTTLDVDILYHPDNWKGTNDDIANSINRKLREYKIEKVDIAILHGAFKYQLPDFLDLLDPEYFLSIVNGPIFCGHIHTHSIYKSIIVPGSFEAMNFGDGELPKGGILTTHHKDGTFDIEFLKNRNQARFKTFKVSKLTPIEIRKKLDKLVDDKIQHIRLIVSDDSLVKSLTKEFSNMYPTIKLKIENEKKVKVNKTIDVSKATVKTINLTNDNISKFIQNNIKDLPITLQESINKELLKNMA